MVLFLFISLSSDCPGLHDTGHYLVLCGFLCLHPSALPPEAGREICLHVHHPALVWWVHAHSIYFGIIVSSTIAVFYCLCTMQKKLQSVIHYSKSQVKKGLEAPSRICAAIFMPSFYSVNCPSFKGLIFIKTDTGQFFTILQNWKFTHPQINQDVDDFVFSDQNWRN